MTDATETRSRTVGWGSIAAAAQMMAGVIRNKALSAAVGTSGIGLIAETQQLATTTFVPGTALAGPALTRAIANTQSTRVDPRPTLDTLLTFTFAYTLIATAVALPVAAHAAPGWASHGMSVVLLPLLTAGAATLTGSFAQVLIAAGFVAQQARAQALSALISAVLASALAFTFGVVGALAGTLVGQLISAFIMLYRCIGRDEFLQWRPRLRLDPKFLAESVRFGATGFAAAAALQGSLTLVRTALGADGTSELNGLFQASWALGYTYLGLLYSGFTSYFFPKIAASPQGGETLREVDDASRFLLHLVVPMVLVAIPLRDLVIRLLYSEAFLGAAVLLGLHLSAAPLRSIGLTFGGSLLFQGRLRAYAGLELAAAAIHGVGALYAAPRWGLMGVGVAYLVSYLAYAWGGWLAVSLSNGWSQSRLQAPLLATVAFLVLVLASAVPQAPALPGVGTAALGALLLFWAGRPVLLSVLRR